MNSEPQCKCPVDRNGGIDHFNDCAWIMWKTGKPEMPTVDNSVHDLNMARLVIKDLKMYPAISSLLVDQIKRNGVLEPITVRDLKNGYYEIIEGVQRFRASIFLGLNSIPGIISE